MIDLIFQVNYKLEIPIGSTAEVHMPNSLTIEGSKKYLHTIMSNNAQIKEASLVQGEARVEDTKMFVVGSGHHMVVGIYEA